MASIFYRIPATLKSIDYNVAMTFILNNNNNNNRSKTILQCAQKPTDLVNLLQSPTPHTPQTGSVTSAEGERRLWLERCGQKVNFETRIETSTIRVVD